MIRLPPNGVLLVDSVTAALPAFVFALAGLSKLSDPFPVAVFLTNAMWIGLPLAFALTRAVAVIELLLAAALCLMVGRSRLPAMMGVFLLLFFVGLLIQVTWLWPEDSSCGCFGRFTILSYTLSLRAQLVVDLGLIALLIGQLLLAPPRFVPIGTVPQGVGAQAMSVRSGGDAEVPEWSMP